MDHAQGDLWASAGTPGGPRRVLAAVLAVAAAVVAPAAATTPFGPVDAVNLNNSGLIWGWAIDTAAPSTSIQVHIYIDIGTPQQRAYAVPTDVMRGDVNAAYGLTGTHGYNFTIPAELRDGVQHWVDVFAIDPHGAGNPPLWGSPSSFTWQLPPAAIVAPTGSIATPNPTYTWSAGTNAQGYTIWVDPNPYPPPPAPATTLRKYYPREQVCVVTSCSATPSLALPQGGYVWWIITNHPDGSETWSAGQYFTVAPPPAPTLLTPSGTVQVPSPVYTWQPVTGATSYELLVDTSPWNTAVRKVTQNHPASVCNGATCSVNADVNLPVGNYDWYVSATGPTGKGPYGGPRGFTVQIAMPTHTSPNAAVSVPTPTYTWTAAPNVTQYQLVVDRTPVGQTATRVHQSWHTTAASCSGPSCSATPATALPIGRYTWFLKSYNASGESDWTGGMIFTVEGPPAPVTLGPTGTLNTPFPTFTWQPVASATQYRVIVDTNPGLPDTPAGFLRQWFNAATACSGGTCTATPTTAFPVMPYRWWISAKNDAGEGNWSSEKHFTVQIAMPTHVAPSGSIVTARPTFAWTHAPGVTSYELGVDKGPDRVLTQRVYAASCSPTACSYETTAALGVGSYAWFLRPSNESGVGGWTTGMSFSVELPGVPVLAAPSGVISTSTPTYAWSVSNNTTSCALDVRDAAGAIAESGDHPVSAICSNGSCAITTGKSLGAGDYSWRIEARSTVGSTFSDWVPFTVRFGGGDSPSLLVNGDFEDGRNAWSEVRTEFPATAFLRGTWGMSAPRTGSAGYSISNQAYGYLQSNPVSVTAGAEYSLSAWVRGEIDQGASTHGWLIQAASFDATGALLERTAVAHGYPGALTTAWQRMGGTFTPPAGTDSLRVEMYLFMASGWVAYDDVELIRVGAVENLVPNPSFEDGTAGWTEVRLGFAPGTSFLRGSWGMSSPHSGSWGYSISNEAYGYLQSDPIAVGGNASYSLRAWVRGQIEEEASTHGWAIRAMSYDALGQAVGYADVASGAPGTLTADWQQVGGPFTTPSNAATVRIHLYLYMASGWIAYDDVELVEDETTHNLAPNPSFEDEGEGWTEERLGFAPGTAFLRGTWGHSAPHTGERAYSVSNHGLGDLRSDAVPVRGGLSYSLSAWVRGEVQDAGAANGWLIRATSYDSTGTEIAYKDVAQGSGASLSTDWQQFGGLFSAPPAAATMRAHLYLTMASGWVAFDDVELFPAGQVTTRPVINPAGGVLTGPIQVTISTTTAEASIYYTLDGSEPTEASEPYTGPLTVAATTTIKAKAFSASSHPSPTASATFVTASDNGRPVVSAGPDLVLYWPGTYLLDGAAWDDGLPVPPGALSVSWTQVSGPASATFGLANSLSTTATFPRQGTYLLRLTATDGHSSASDDVLVGIRGSVLLVVENPAALTLDDEALQQRLQAIGMSVTVAAAATARSEQAFGRTAVVISPSAPATQVVDHFRQVQAPVLATRAPVFRDMAMTDPGAVWDESGSQLAVLAPQHALAAGLSGAVSVYADAGAISCGSPTATGVSVLAMPADNGRAAVFAYEAGAAMVGQPAPARRVAFGLLPSALSSEGVRVLDAALRWLTGVGTQAPGGPVVVPPQVESGQSVTFNASGAQDPDGAIISYFWDFGDGTTATGPAPHHVYEREGTYTVTLTMTDDTGLTTTLSWTVTVLASLRMVNVRVASLAADSATIAWDVDRPAQAVVQLGTTPSYDRSIHVPAGTLTSYVVPLDGLAVATQYHYRVTAVASNGATASSADYTFRTPDASDRVAEDDRASPAHGSAPGGVQAGSPVGSFPLADFESVNLYNGVLSLTVPVVSLAGRAGNGVKIPVKVDPLPWIVERGCMTLPNGSQICDYFPRKSWEPDASYKIGMVGGQWGGWGRTRCNDDPPEDLFLSDTLLRLSFLAADGTSYEMFDAKTKGTVAQAYCPHPEFNRGRVFETNDGTAATFVSDTTLFDSNSLQTPLRPFSLQVSGWLYGADGTAYRVNNSDVTTMRDRNGNVMTFEYLTYPRGTLPRAYTDMLGRRVEFAHRLSTNQLFSEETAISFPGSGGSKRTVTVTSNWLRNALYGKEPQGPFPSLRQLFPELPNQGEHFEDPGVVTGIVLPDGRRYSFHYNTYGEVRAVVLPTGGGIEYEYGDGLRSGGKSSGVLGVPIAVTSAPPPTGIYRRLLRKLTYANGLDQPPTALTEYGRAERADTQPSYRVFCDDLDEDDGTQVCPVLVTHKTGDGARVLGIEKHYFYGPEGRTDRGAARSILDALVGEDAYPGLRSIKRNHWREGKEYKVKYYDGDGRHLRTVVRDWENAQQPAGPRVTEARTRLDDGQQSRTSYSHDGFNNVTSAHDHDYGDALLRAVSTTYETSAAYTASGLDPDNPPAASVHLRRLVRQQDVTDAMNDLAARTSYELDGTPLLDRSGIIQHDPTYGSGFTLRGSVTGVGRWLNTNGSTLWSQHHFDVAGNVVRTLDPNGSQTETFYEDQWSGAGSPGLTFAMPTRLRNALGHEQATWYDYGTTRPVAQRDANQVETQLFYADPLDRLTKAVIAANVAEAQQTITYEYADASRRISTFSDMVNVDDGAMRRDLFYDRLGRTTRALVWADKAIATDTTYDALGRVAGVSNPYYLDEQEPEWTSTGYDGLGRVTSLRTPDDAVAWTSYSGPTATTTDPAGKARSTTADALGRPTHVVEDPAGQNLTTSYEHDVLGNLRSVQQGAQTRSFVYDSLSRLTRSSQPESGTILYGYDANGNLTNRTDARGVVTDIQYDALNRPRSRTFSDGTASVGMAYDDPAVSYSIGRLSHAEAGMTRSEYRQYDATGRPLALAQVIAGDEYLVAYSYNRAGMIVAETYPTGRVALPRYDAAGRVTGLLTEKAGEPRVSVVIPGTVTYAAHGGVTAQQLGNGKWERAEFNPRLQVSRIGVGHAQNGFQALDLRYDYGGTENNGNVRSQTIGAGSATFSQEYQYDGLNRLWTAVDSGGWSQTYGYDRYGNRWLVPGSSCPGNCSGTPQSETSFDSASNRISIPGVSYDLAGNLRVDWLGRTAEYDAENRQVSYQGGGNGAAYSYDSAGRRVRKVETDGTTTTYIYDASGQLIVELSSRTPRARELLYAGGRRVATVYGSLRASGAVFPTPCLARPELRWPYGWIYTEKPTFSWVGDPAATTYSFTVQAEGKAWLSPAIVLPASEVCQAGVCSVTSTRLGLRFPKNHYFWKVGSRNDTCTSHLSIEHGFWVRQPVAVPGDERCDPGEHCSTSPECGTCQSGGGSVGACLNLSDSTCSTRCGGGWTCELPYPPGGSQGLSCAPCPSTPPTPPPPPPPLPSCSQKGGDYCADPRVKSCFVGDTDLGRSSDCQYSCCKTRPGPICGDLECNGQEHCTTCPGDCGTCSSGGGSLGSCVGLPETHCDGKCGDGWWCELPYPAGNQPISCPPCRISNLVPTFGRPLTAGVTPDTFTPRLAAAVFGAWPVAIGILWAARRRRKPAAQRHEDTRGGLQ